LPIYLLTIALQNGGQRVKPWLRVLLVAIAVILLAIVVGPFVVPVPPLDGTVPPEDLAEPDSRFVDVNGIRVHYKIAGRGKPAILLLHGFAASTFSWREVMDPLSEFGTVIAFDRPAFGLTERPLPGDWEGESPYSPESQADLTVGLIDALEIHRAVLVGHSAGGAIAILTALTYPARVDALVLVDAAVYRGGGTPPLLRPLMQTPQMRRLGPVLSRRITEWGIEFARSAWYDPEKISPHVWEGYLQPLKAQNWDVGLWELTRASHSSHLPERLGELDLPALVITGEEDRIVPPGESARLAEELSGGTLVVIPACGHVPHEECPGRFLRAATEFLASAD
jgi:pimeloyl-ACP methyl ester carboxylesterase